MDMKIGEVVQLKSGGPFMTVQEVKEVVREDVGHVWVTCVWFSPCGEYQTTSFVKDTLKTPDERTF